MTWSWLLLIAICEYSKRPRPVHICYLTRIVKKKIVWQKLRLVNDDVVDWNSQN